MSDKYPGVSPYAYCANNPVKLVDEDGREGTIPPWLLGPAVAVVKGTARIVETFSTNSDIKTTAYAINHPINALRTGIVKDGGTNISSIASNFAINIQEALELKVVKEGGDARNAIRHVLWQAMLTVRFGENQAERIGNAHEDNTSFDRYQRNFSSLSEADAAADMLNNEIGRNIGVINPEASNKTLVKRTVEKFYRSGLWTVSKQNDGWQIQRTKITREQYETALKTINRKNEYGLYQ